mgnify:CR=1 FL=1
MVTTLVADLGTMVDAVTAVMGLFAEYPLNLIIASMVGGMAFGWFRKAKRAVK